MTIEELEAEALKMNLESRARLAERLLRSLEDLSEEENSRLWAEEAARRNPELDANPQLERPGAEVFRDAWARLG